MLRSVVLPHPEGHYADELLFFKNEIHSMEHLGLDFFAVDLGDLFYLKKRGGAAAIFYLSAAILSLAYFALHPAAAVFYLFFISHYELPPSG